MDRSKLPPPETVNEDFLKKMRTRMLMSYYKYGPATEMYPDKVDSLACVRQRIALYEKTGNTEWLIDAANQLMLEFTYPSHSEAHFRATDSDESPGLVKRDDRLQP